MSCAKLLRSADMFGAPINFSYKGSPLFTTRAGGCATILLGVTLFLYLIVAVAEIMFQGSKFTVLDQTRYLYWGKNDTMKEYTLGEDYAFMGGLHNHSDKGFPEGVTID